MDLKSYGDIAKLLDYPLLRVEMTQDDVAEGCEFARDRGLACVNVRPCDVELAVRMLGGSEVKIGVAAGFPHGWSTTAVKLYEVRDLLRRGAQEIEMSMNIPKLLSRQFQYLEAELMQAAEACHKEGAVLKLTLEDATLTPELKLVAYRLCENTGADFASVPLPADVTIARGRLAQRVGVKLWMAEGLDAVLQAYDAGARRVGSTAPSAILEDWNARLKAEAATSQNQPT